jgi:hypothetical protein
MGMSEHPARAQVPNARQQSFVQDGTPERSLHCTKEFVRISGKSHQMTGFSISLAPQLIGQPAFPAHGRQQSLSAQVRRPPAGRGSCVTRCPQTARTLGICAACGIGDDEQAKIDPDAISTLCVPIRKSHP